MENSRPKELLDLGLIKDTLNAFAIEREWEKYHSPKNLSMAMVKESAELLEIFQWMTEDESRLSSNDENIKQNISDEMADIMSYLIRLSDILDIDLSIAIKNKIEKNSKKYPVHLAKGNCKKYVDHQT